MKKKPMTQGERSEKAAEKKRLLGEVKIQLSMAEGTKEALREVMAMAKIKEQGEAITLAIHNLRDMGRDKALQILEYQESIDKPKRPEKVSFGARKGTVEAMAQLMEWTGIESRGEIVEAIILRLNSLGMDAKPIVSHKPHVIAVSDTVGRMIFEKGMKESELCELDE